MKTSYGLEYIGSKNLIAKSILELLPSADYLVDCFGGGGSITHCALLSNKYKKVIYNESDYPIYSFFKLIHDDYKQVEEWLKDDITKDYYFKHIEDNTPYSGYLQVIYSFNGLKKSSRLTKIESEDCIRRIKECKNRVKNLKVLQDYKNIDFFNLSYDEIPLPKPDSCILYCDPPYINTSYYTKNSFDFDKFLDWCREKYKQGYKVFISSYDNLDYKDLKIVWQTYKTMGINFTKHSNKLECVYAFDEENINLQQKLF